MKKTIHLFTLIAISAISLYLPGTVPPANQWSFVAMVAQPTQAVLYLMNASGQFSATNVVAHTSDVFGNNWEIGSDDNSANNNGSRTFTGLIDEVAVFNYSLTPAQLTTLLNAGTPQPVVITIQPSGANVTLTWPKGTLLEANDLLGPWATNNAVIALHPGTNRDQEILSGSGAVAARNVGIQIRHARRGLMA